MSSGNFDCVPALEILLRLLHIRKVLSIELIVLKLDLGNRNLFSCKRLIYFFFFLDVITETTDIYKSINSKEESILWRNRKLPDDQLYLRIIQDLSKQAVNIPRLHYGVTHSVNSELTSNGKTVFFISPYI